MLTDKTIKGFLAETAGDAPVPGGGSISALNGSIAAALTEMVANLTIGRKKYAEVEDEMNTIACEVAKLQSELVIDVDKDSEAYNRVFAAFKLPKDTEEEKAHRSAEIQKNSKYAAEVPMEVARRVSKLLPMIEAVIIKGNQNAITDGCVAMMCAKVAVVGALFNVRINLTSIKDADFVARMTEEADLLEADVVAREKHAIEITKEACK